MKPVDILSVFVGAGVGGVLRYMLGVWLAARWGSSFPWATFAVNLSGAFLLGLLMALTVGRSQAAPAVQVFLGVGVLGGFTTFSTLSYESVALVERGLYLRGAVNMLGSAVLGMVAVAAGLFAGRAV